MTKIMGTCCKNRFPCPHSVQNLASYGTRRTHDSCQGTSCSRSCTPGKPRPPLWEPKPGPYTHRQNSRPQTAPITVSASFKPYVEERPASAQSNRSNISYESCQYSTTCSRSPCSTPRKLEDPVHTWEPKRPISPAGWTYAPKRQTRRGKWWDKDWKIAERSTHYYDPKLQDCGCFVSRPHSDSRTPSPPRSPRDIGVQYHLDHLAKEAQRKADAKQANSKSPRDNEGSNFQGWGHCHRYQKWSCCTSKNPSRSTTPKARPRSRSPSPTRSTGSATPREKAPLKQRPQTPRGQQTPYITPHGHCHTYNSWSCNTSKPTTPRAPSPERSRSPTPPKSPVTTTIKVTYSPPPENEPCSPCPEPCCCTTDQNLQDANEAPPQGRLFVSHHCHHCQLYHPTCRICPTCGHSHGHHGQTLFTLAPSPPAPTTTHANCHGHHHHDWHHQHGYHHGHHHHHHEPHHGHHHHGHHHHPCDCFHHCHHC